MDAVMDDLLAELALAKTNESNARDRRIQVEEKIISQFTLGDKERKTVKGSNGLTVTIQTGLSYKLEKGFPETMPVKTKVELDESAYEKLRELNPKQFSELAKFVTTKPKKPSLTLKVG